MLKRIVRENPALIKAQSEIVLLNEKLDSVRGGFENALNEAARLAKEREADILLHDSQVRDLARKLRREEIKLRRLLFENEDLKHMLSVELQRAEVTCKMLEDQLRELPKPYEEELVEVRCGRKLHSFRV